MSQPFAYETKQDNKYRLSLSEFNKPAKYRNSTAQKIKFCIKDFFTKCDQIRRKPRIWSHLLKKSLMENFIFCAVELLTGFL